MTVLDSSIRAAECNDALSLSPPYDCEEEDALEWLLSQISSDPNELICGIPLPSLVVYRDSEGAVFKKDLYLPSSAEIVDERNCVTPCFMDERSSILNWAQRVRSHALGVSFQAQSGICL